MTTCETIQPRLTAYLDGELEGEPGRVVRGHLRECEACRQVARDEAALRDGLRVLPPVDPPASLWAGVQAQLAAAEVADAHRPRWRRALARWARWAPWPLTMPQAATGGVLVAAAVVTLYWRSQRVDDMVAESVAVTVSPVKPEERVAPTPPSPPSADDVTADLVAEPARTTEMYGQAIEELMTIAVAASAGWTQDEQDAFNAEVATLRARIGKAAPGRPQQRAQRALMRYVQRAAVRDVVVLASGGNR
jgi:anti-sigma factor RsiW